jgi:hypothetical protein
MERAFFRFTLDTRVMIVGLALESLLQEADSLPDVRFVPRDPGPSAEPTLRLVRSATTDHARIPSRRAGRGRSEPLTSSAG